MFRNLLRTALRSLLRYKLQSLVSVASLALGLAVFGFAFLYVKQQLSYNRGWPEAQYIHRLLVEQNGVPGARDGLSNSVRGTVWPNITEYFAAEIDAASRTFPYYLNVKDTEPPAGMNVTFVDAGFSAVFPLEVVAGDLERALSGPGLLAIEESVAAGLGADVALGKRLTLFPQRGDALEFEVAAIYRLPSNTSSALDFSMLTLIHEYAHPLFGDALMERSWEAFTPVWLKLKRGVGTDAFNAQQTAFLQNAVNAYAPLLGTRPIGDHVFYRWQPLSDVYLNPVGQEVATAGNAARVTSFAAIGVLVLLVGCSNSISLGLARALVRRKEVGIRKVAGALRRDLVVQQLGEAALLALIAWMPAVALLELLLPAFQALLPFRLGLNIGHAEYLVLGVLAVLVGVANGIYPALVLASVRPQAVLKPGMVGGMARSQSVRGLLIGAQFCLASILLIATAALYVQLAIARAMPLGFNPSNLVFAYFGTGLNVDNTDTLRTELLRIPGMVSVSSAYSLPNAYAANPINPTLLVNKEAGSGEVEALTIASDHELFATLDIPLIAGRAYDLARDRAGSTPGPIILNRTATRALGFANPSAAIDRIIYRQSENQQSGQFVETPLRIIGVVEDSLFAAVRRRPGPEAYMMVSPGNGPPSRFIRYDAAIESSVQEHLNDVGQRLFGAPPQVIRFIEPIMDGVFLQDRNEGKLLLISGGLALVLACVGLYGLAAFAMERSTKEVGVRKVMGARLGSLLALFLWRFTRPVIVANLLAWPAALYFVLQWLERFPYQLDKAWLLPLCLGAMLTVSLIAVLTVSFVTLRAASASPVRALTYE